MAKGNSKCICFVLLVTTLFITVVSGSQAGEGRSPFDPAPAGAKLSGIIECGRGYTSHELYDMKITMLEVIRGDKAWKRLHKVSTVNKPAGRGFEYILARLKFEYDARGKPGLCVHKLTPEQFTACSMDGEDYPYTDLILPGPGMRGDLSSGDSLEGWIALLVPITDEKPLLYYSADAGKAVLHGGNIWFKLN
ncbi:hypothetical protein ACFL1N_07105 [Thermodesulfobacteriota bacterium]